MSDIALITTTITVPTVLAEYRRIGPDVEIIVAGDVTGPQAEIANFCHSINARYISYEEQGRLGYAVHDIIGPRSIQRRNIAILEAIRSGANIIYTMDTDNSLIDEQHFTNIHAHLSQPQTRTVYTSSTGWLDVGAFASPETYTARGFPVTRWHESASYLTRRAQVHIGVFSSLILSDPDISAVERILLKPDVTDYDIGVNHVITIDPKATWAPINTQATAVVREVSPLLFVLPGVGRFDDILALYIAQRVMQATDYHVGFGAPFVRQDRHEHDLLKDLEHELFGMRYTERFCDLLHAAPTSPDASIIDNLDAVCRHIEHHAWTDTDDYFLPDQTARFMNAWVEDVGRLL